MNKGMSVPVVEEPSAVVDKLSSLLAQRPTHFEITILSGTNSCADESKGQSLSLDESLVLVDGRYLGLDARSLPSMTREIRQQYKRLKLQLDSCSGGVGGDDKTMWSLALLNTLSCLLLVNPDHATAWADRRRCLLQSTGVSKDDANLIWTKELDFVNLLMTQHPKAPFSWAHRKYILEKLIQTGGDEHDRPHLLALFENEIKVCRDVAERYPKNYYAWTHRRFILGKVMVSTSVPVDQKVRSLESEWDDIVTKWLPAHVSDHSAVHYASQVLEFWMGQLQNSSMSGNTEINSLVMDQLATQVMTQVRSLVDSSESHETLWILRRLVIRILWESQITFYETVVLEDVTAVATSIEQWMSNEDTTNCAVTPNVHALTFLAWIEEVQQMSIHAVKGNYCFSSVQADEAKRLSLLLVLLSSILQDHPLVYHGLWKVTRPSGEGQDGRR